jgi:hypothetical protein
MKNLTSTKRHKIQQYRKRKVRHMATYPYCALSTQGKDNHPKASSTRVVPMMFLLLKTLAARMKLLPPARWEPSLKWMLPREAFPRSSYTIASPSSTDTLFSPCPLLIIWWSKSSSVQSPLQEWPCSRATISTSSEERSPDVIIWSPLQIAISIGPPLLYRSKESFV